MQLHVGLETVRGWQRMPDFPAGPPWDIDAVLAWVKQMRSRSKIRGDDAAAPGESYGDIGVGRERESNKDLKTRLEAAWIAEKLRRLRGESINKADVSKLLLARIREFKKAGRKMDRRLRPQLLGLADPDLWSQIFLTEFDRICMEAYGRDDDSEEPRNETEPDSIPP